MIGGIITGFGGAVEDEVCAPAVPLLLFLCCVFGLLPGELCTLARFLFLELAPWTSFGLVM